MKIIKVEKTNVVEEKNAKKTTNVYEKVREFAKKYPFTVMWWRLKKHSDVVQRHMNEDEYVRYAFAGQKNNSFIDIFQTYVIVVTNKRILLGRKRLVFGYFLYSITPDLFNDLEVYQGLIFGTITIDTIKEEVFVSNLDKRSLPEIETAITSFMMEEKRKYGNREKKEVQD